MHSATVVLLLGLSAMAFAQFGRGGPQWPQSCNDDGAKTQQCFEAHVQAKGINVNLAEVQKCFASCQPEHAKGNGKGTFPKEGGHASASGDAHAKVGPAGFGGHGAANASAGNWEQFKDEMQKYQKCIDAQLNGKQQTCESGKITFALSQPVPKGEHAKGEHDAPRGGPQMGFGNPLKSLKDRVAKCSAAETCVRSALGEWFDKTDELSQILCDASTACPHTMSDQCKSELKQINDARCQCTEQLRPDVEQAQKDCATTPETSDALARMSQRAGGVAKQASSFGCGAEPKEHAERPPAPSPFCPRPEGGESKGLFSKSRLGVAVNNGGH